MSIKIKRIVSIIIFVIGFIMVSFPMVANAIEINRLKNTLGTYESQLAVLTDDEKQTMYDNAKSYNEKLFELNNLYYDENANTYIDVGNGIIGKIEIPIIDVDLPIYNGTSDEVLSVGAGHLENTSLPIGGLNTHSTITGHRGLPNSKLFTRLDELKVGDMFYISVLNETLAYKVYDIRTISPNDTSLFSIEQGKDIVSLMTCTPYGLNTHRLIVTGERVEYNETVKKEIKGKMMSIRELIFIILPFIFIGIAIFIIIKNRRKKLNEYTDKNNTINIINNNDDSTKTHLC